MNRIPMETIFRFFTIFAWLIALLLIVIIIGLTVKSKATDVRIVAALLASISWIFARGC